MTVSIKGLRDAADFMRQASGVDPAFLREAADEIESLRERLEMCRNQYDAALKRIDALQEELGRF